MGGYDWQPPQTPNSALRSLDKMFIYLWLGAINRRPYTAFVSVASLDFGVCGGCQLPGCVVVRLSVKIPSDFDTANASRRIFESDDEQKHPIEFDGN